MTRTLIVCLTLGALCLLSSQPVAAAIGPATLYDTIDEINVLNSRITVTGIIAGQSAPSTTTYSIWSTSVSSSDGAVDVAASRCDRLALLAMSKPGKFQFGVTLEVTSPLRHSCKLIVRTP